MNNTTTKQPAAGGTVAATPPPFTEGRHYYWQPPTGRRKRVKLLTLSTCGRYAKVVADDSPAGWDWLVGVGELSQLSEK